MIRKVTYLYSDIDRHGNRRWYFKPPGWDRKVRIKEAEGTRKFNDRYAELVEIWSSGDTIKARANRVSPTDLEWLFRQYMASQTFHDLAESTRTQRKNFMVRTARLHGRKAYRSIGAQEIAAIRDSFGSRKGAARNFLKTMRAVFAWACSDEQSLLSENPTIAVKVPQVKTDGHPQWTTDDVARFLNHYELGSKPRLTLTLLLCTGQRISDIRTLGRPNIISHEGRQWLRIKQKKTCAIVEIPLLETLQAEIDPVQKQIVWLQSEQGKPFSEKSLPQKFSKWASDAGINKSAHGLRKSVGSILAELGVSEDAIMAVLGHTSSSEARTYIRNVNRKRLSGDAMTKLEHELSHLWSGGKVGS